MSTNINILQEACSMCGQVHTSTGCKLVLDGGPQMTNEKDREDTHVHILKPAWICDTCGKIILPEGEDARIRSEAVKAEREKWKPVYEALKRVLNDKKPSYHDCIDDGEPECAWCEADRALESILSDDQEAVKTNDDVDHDLLTIDRCIRYPEHFPGIALEASAALERLALRVKEEGRG